MEPPISSRGSGRRWGWLRPIGALVVLAFVVWNLGTGPFLDGIESVDGGAVLAAALITVVTTAAAAWRWQLVARALGVDIAWTRAVLAYYRSQFLNTTLPSGLLGDVHRGVRYGRLADDLSGGLRSVAWERAVGQVVQAFTAAVVLVFWSAPVESGVPLDVAAAILGGALLIGVLLWIGPGRAPMTRFGRGIGMLRGDLRVLLVPRTAAAIVGASFVAAAGHVATFVVAARAAGVTASPRTLVPLALLVLLAAALPLNVAGWGLREGSAAWVFGAAGLGAASGITTATAFGVMTLIATLPGGAILLASAIRDRDGRNRGGTPALKGVTKEPMERTVRG